MIPASALHAQQFPASGINPEKWPKTAVFGGRVNSFERGTCFTVNDSLYSRPIFPLSNGAYRVSLRPSVVEHSTQDRSGVAPFFDPVNFPGSMLNQRRTMVHVITFRRRPVYRRGPNSNTMHSPSETTICQNWEPLHSVVCTH